ncbi:hypothetical protein MNBD_NITROSPIRAE03-1619 [hydrothermal vent metagenome]|uniref:UspA domain-containing protein n=1 Tax=hydrothermal vent metagenome TaxID=652676 RepID=A0A3B1CVF5_9ZZZZ
MKILIAVDESTGSRAVVPFSANILKCVIPEAVILVYVEKLQGYSLIDRMLGDAELSTLKDTIKETDIQEALDRKGKKILESCRKAFEEKGVKGIKTVLRSGHPADEILETAGEEGVDMIIIGSRGKRVSHLFMGSVSREVAERADMPVLLVKGQKFEV